MWKGGLKFERRVISRRKLTKREMRKLLGKRTVIQDSHSLLHKELVFALGKLKLGFAPEEVNPIFNNFIQGLREKGYPQLTIDKMIRKSLNRYKFGCEVARMTRSIH